jgi:aminobenzoyl-glutamate transport protein
LAYFSWSNIGAVVAIAGANLLASSGFPIFIVVVLFILGSAFLDFMIGSASAKWGLLGPIFVPMFMLLGYHPSFIQCAYLIGDAIVNPITPGLPYLAILLANCRKYDDSIGLGSLIASLMPYSIAYTIGLISMLAIWYFFKLPFGPDGPMLLIR